MKLCRMYNLDTLDVIFECETYYGFDEYCLYHSLETTAKSVRRYMHSICWMAS